MARPVCLQRGAMPKERGRMTPTTCLTASYRSCITVLRHRKVRADGGRQRRMPLRSPTIRQVVGRPINRGLRRKVTGRAATGSD